MMYFASCKDQGMSIDEIEDHSIIEDFKFQKEMWRQSGNKWLNLISVLKIIFYLDYIAFFNYITIWLFLENAVSHVPISISLHRCSVV